jgi:hypothetical protein
MAPSDESEPSRCTQDSIGIAISRCAFRSSLQRLATQAELGTQGTLVSSNGGGGVENSHLNAPLKDIRNRTTTGAGHQIPLTQTRGLVRQHILETCHFLSSEHGRAIAAPVIFYKDFI